jgi:phospholipid transport system substrate-binding protein
VGEVNMLRRFFSIGLVAVTIGLLAARPGQAAPDPRAFVDGLGTQGIEMIGPNVPPDQRLARFRQIFQNDFDVPGIARFALGRYWRAYDPQQQEEFLKLFQEYTVLAYAERLGKYSGAQFRTTAAAPNGDEVVVDSQVLSNGGKPVEMDWHLVRAGDGYKVSDVYVDGVSMKVTQRDEFAKVIQNNGGRPDTLLAVLRQQIREKEQKSPAGDAVRN